MAMRSDRETPRPQDLKTVYQQLGSGAETLLGVHLFWTERKLLELVSYLYRRQLQQLRGVLAEAGFLDTDAAVREALLEAKAEAALGGHELSAWEPVDTGYQARCSKCSMTSWIFHDGVRYSLLDDECPGDA